LVEKNFVAPECGHTFGQKKHDTLSTKGFRHNNLRSRFVPIVTDRPEQE